MRSIKRNEIKTKLASYFQLLRPKQWIKNLFLFAALIFSRNFDKLPYILSVIYAFVCFCAISSTVYIFNDMHDLEKDRKHPKKCRRPLAAGLVSKKEALVLAVLILPIAAAASFLLKYSFGWIVVAYLLNNLLYTLYVKNQVILDVMSIAMGFILRVAGGAVIIDVVISPWLILCTFLLALFLALSKRRSELLVLQEEAQSHRSILEQYSIDFIDNMLSVVTASTLISYCMYTFFASEDKSSMITILFVLYGIFRYQYIIYNKKLGDSPEEIVLTDMPLLINILLWVSSSIIILY